MNCPYCNFKFRLLVVNAPAIPDLAPAICEDCGQISLFHNGTLRTVNQEELAAIQASPAWDEMLGPVQKFIREKKRKVAN